MRIYGRQEPETIMVAPVHLKGARQIAETFSVSRDTVSKWAKNGAPLAYVGGKLQGDYHALFNWLLATRPGGRSAGG